MEAQYTGYIVTNYAFLTKHACLKVQMVGNLLLKIPTCLLQKNKGLIEIEILSLSKQVHLQLTRTR